MKKLALILLLTTGCSTSQIDWSMPLSQSAKNDREQMVSDRNEKNRRKNQAFMEEYEREHPGIKDATLGISVDFYDRNGQYTGSAVAD